MSVEVLDLKRINVDAVEILKYEVYDLNGSTVFSLSSGTWALYDRTTGSVVTSGAVTVNNADEDRAGNTIKTVSFTLDCDNTDIVVAYYFLIIKVVLSTGQSQFFRVPVEMVDLREVA